MTMLARCNYWKLLADLHYYTTGEWKLPEMTCPNLATHYTCVDITAGDYAGQSYTNLCAEHEPMVRGLSGWRWSRRREEVSA